MKELLLVCTALQASSPEAQRFELRLNPTAPRSSIYDAPLMDPPVTKGSKVSMTFSNQCENMYTVEIDRATLKGTLIYFNPDTFDAKTSTAKEERVPLVCTVKK